MMLLLESKDDKNEAEEFVQVFGVDLFWSNILVFLGNGVSENFIKSLLKMPTEVQIVAKIGSELAENGKLSIISDFVLKNEALTEEAQMFSLKLKILCENANDELFLTSMMDPMVTIVIFTCVLNAFLL